MNRLASIIMVAFAMALAAGQARAQEDVTAVYA